MDRYLETIKVSDHVYVFKPKIDWVHGNGVAILGPDGVFFVDTYIQFNYAEEAIRRLRKVTRLPVRYVLNTHWHNDHVTGNGVFKQAFPHCQFIAHDSTATYLERLVKPAVDSEAVNFDRSLAELTKQAANVKLGAGGTRYGTSLKPYLEALVSETQAYRREFHAAPFVNADITFSDSLTMRWGSNTFA